MGRGAHDALTTGLQSGEPERSARERGTRPGAVLLWSVTALFVAIAIPVLLRGAPLADDFTNCMQTQRFGIASALADSIDRLGASRKAHLVEILLTGGVCGHVPFGVAIAVPLALTVGIAFLLRGLLRDVGAPSPWPEIGGAFWLLAPLGTESALWPAALHVPLGLALAVVAIRLRRFGRPLVASLAVVGAGLSVEQALLALPVAVWLLTPADRRRAATLATTAVAGVVLISIFVWPGNDPRLHVTLAGRLSSAVHDPEFPFRFAAVGLGVHSIPLAVGWAFPVSAVLLGLGAAIGWWFAPRLLPTVADEIDRAAWPSVTNAAIGAIALLAAVNAPVIFNVPHQGSPRLFAPSWLVIAGFVGFAGPWIGPKRVRAWGLAGAMFASAALLSLALSMWVRLESASFSEYALRRIAAEVPDGSVVAVCAVTRTIEEPAPRGGFSLHELVYAWAARDALEYYEGKRVTFRLAGPLWGRPCPAPDTVDRVFSFSRLIAGWRGDD
jgi:hypothetical protein